MFSRGMLSSKHIPLEWSDHVVFRMLSGAVYVLSLFGPRAAVFGSALLAYSICALDLGSKLLSLSASLLHPVTICGARLVIRGRCTWSPVSMKAKPPCTLLASWSAML